MACRFRCPWPGLLRLLVRECRFGLGVAAFVGCGRVVSEVGVAMILGGNIKGFPRTLTTAIALEMAKGDAELALGSMLLGASLGNALLVHGLQVAAASRQTGKAAEEPAAFCPDLLRGDETSGTSIRFPWPAPSRCWRAF